MYSYSNVCIILLIDLSGFLHKWMIPMSVSDLSVEHMKNTECRITHDLGLILPFSTCPVSPRYCLTSARHSIDDIVKKVVEFRQEASDAIFTPTTRECLYLLQYNGQIKISSESIFRLSQFIDRHYTATGVKKVYDLEATLTARNRYLA
jgi:hypothetical protein